MARVLIGERLMAYAEGQIAARRGLERRPPYLFDCSRKVLRVLWLLGYDEATPRKES